MTLLIVLVVAVIWISALVVTLALCRMAKQGDRQTIVDDSPQLDTPIQRMVRP